jgi:hypothetical protein
VGGSMEKDEYSEAFINVVKIELFFLLAFCDISQTKQNISDAFQSHKMREHLTAAPVFLVI